MPPRIDPFVSPLTPGDAVAAVLIIGGRYLLQFRDPDRPIFFPGHWGLFGGAIDPGEDEVTALRRELEEELSLSVSSEQMRYFTRFLFDFGFSGSPMLSRGFYVIDLPAESFAGLRLSEGREMRLFSSAEIFDSDIRLTPYDSFALWMYHNRQRLMPVQKTLPEGRDE